MRVISLNEAASRINVSRRTLNRVIARGLGPPTIRLSPRLLGVAESDFERWLETRRQASLSPKGGNEAA